jgi:hypothetical protein
VAGIGDPGYSFAHRMRIALLFVVLFALASTQAQLTAPSPAISPTVSPLPSPPPRNVPLRFALPPLEGTISLGIYDGAGKLVRVLHREDAVTDFTAGNDALETDWDGNDEEGHPLPNGKYNARGYVVGDLKVEGVDYFFNDWVKDEKSPHIRRLAQLWMENGELRVDAELAGGKATAFICDQTTGAILREVTPTEGMHCNQVPAPPNIVHAIDCAAGKDGTTWFVDALDENKSREVKQLSKKHEVLRRLDYVGDDPRPERIEASTLSDKIFLVEQSRILQRLRGLTLVRTLSNAAEGPVSDWKSLFDKKIIEHQNFSLVNDRPVAASAAAAGELEKITQSLLPNPLQNDQPGKVDLAVGLDADGSFLSTSDGLPLRTISETPNLSRALINSTSSKAADVFQDDGAVVEQYRVSGLDQMMAFDCGEFELK